MNNLLLLVAVIVIQTVLLLGTAAIGKRVTDRDLALPLQLVFCATLPALALWWVGPLDAYYIATVQAVFTAYLAWSWGRKDGVDDLYKFVFYGGITAAFLAFMGVAGSVAVWHWTLPEELRGAPEQIRAALDKTPPAKPATLRDEMHLEKPYLIVDCGPGEYCSAARSNLLSLPAWCRSGRDRAPKTIVARVFKAESKDFEAVAFEWPTLRRVGVWSVASSEEELFFDSLAYATTPAAHAN